jgi:hypothetical protein
MSHRVPSPPRRRFLVSALSTLGGVLSLGSLALIAGCSDDKAGGQIENPGDVTKTPDAQDSMKASMDMYRKKGIMKK